jgi:cell division protein FtsB
MNVYKSTGKTLESWPQWVSRLIKVNQELREEIADLKAEIKKLKDDK